VTRAGEPASGAPSSRPGRHQARITVRRLQSARSRDRWEGER
jgi:hypothetical protein